MSQNQYHIVQIDVREKYNKKQVRPKNEVDLGNIANWGRTPFTYENDTPKKFVHFIEQQPIISSALSKKVEILTSGRIKPILKTKNAGVWTETDLIDEEIEDFFSNSIFSSFQETAATNYYYWGMPCPVLQILNKKIIGIYAVDASQMRYKKLNENGEITEAYQMFDWAYYKLSAESNNNTMITYPLFDTNVKMLTSGVFNDWLRDKSISEQSRVMIRLQRFSPQRLYYPFVPYQSLFESDWYNLEKLVSGAYASFLKNAALPSLVVYVPDKYLRETYPNWTQPSGQNTIENERGNILTKIKNDIRDKIQGSDNAGRIITSVSYTDVQGNETKIKLEPMKLSAEISDVHLKALQEAMATHFIALQMPPQLLGVTPAGINNSGAGEREARRLYQADLPLADDYIWRILLKFIAKYNGWYDRYLNINQATKEITRYLDFRKDYPEFQTMNEISPSKR